MKYIYSLLLTFLCATGYSQFYFTGGYSLSAPQQKMADNIKPIHSLSAGVTYQLPGKWSRVYTGIEAGWGVYANDRKTQTFTFDNGDVTKTDVNYSSNVVQGSFTARVLLLENKKIMPYVNGKAGYASFYSNIYIEDPHDNGACKALDKRNIIKDGSIITGYGGGLLADWSVFSKKIRKGHGYLDLSVNSIRGNNINYINTKKLYDAANPPVGSDGKPLSIQFINASTQQIHEHQVAEVYNSPIRLFEYRISAFLPLN